MQEWMLALYENVHSPDYCERGAHGSAQRQVLDLPTRWRGFYSPRTPRQLHHPVAWKHGRADDLLVRTERTAVALLRLDGDGWFCGRGLCDIQVGAQRGERNPRAQVPPKTLDKVYKRFERWGLGAIAIPALLPPPVPMLPFLFGAGAMQYPVRKFLLALTMGRIIRYTLLAFLAARYGRPILAFIAQHGHPGLFIVAGLIATLAAILFVVFAGKRQRHGSS